MQAVASRAAWASCVPDAARHKGRHVQSRVTSDCCIAEGFAADGPTYAGHARRMSAAVGPWHHRHRLSTCPLCKTAAAADCRTQRAARTARPASCDNRCSTSFGQLDNVRPA